MKLIILLEKFKRVSQDCYSQLEMNGIVETVIYMSTSAPRHDKSCYLQRYNSVIDEDDEDFSEHEIILPQTY